MKTLLILALALSSYGCKKCADCTTITTTKVTGQPTQSATTKTEQCGDNLKEMDGNVTTSTATYQGVTATVTSSTQCN